MAPEYPKISVNTAMTCDISVTEPIKIHGPDLSGKRETAQSYPAIEPWHWRRPGPHSRHQNSPGKRVPYRASAAIGH
ncbi:hypothetical protein MOKP76_05740 [Mycobacterium avium subsp. hominissuis]